MTIQEKQQLNDALTIAHKLNGKLVLMDGSTRKVHVIGHSQEIDDEESRWISEFRLILPINEAIIKSLEPCNNFEPSKNMEPKIKMPTR